MEGLLERTPSIKILFAATSVVQGQLKTHFTCGGYVEARVPLLLGQGDSLR